MEVLNRVVEGEKISYHGSLMSSEPWWYRCITLSDDPSRFGKFCEFRVLVKLAESRSVIYCKRSRSWCDWHLYRKPVIYRSNTCRNSENAFHIPTLIQRNLLQITNGWINGLQQIIGTQRVEIWGLLDGRHYKINRRFHFGERLIIIVNSRGLISVTHVLRF